MIDFGCSPFGSCHLDQSRRRSLGIYGQYGYRKISLCLLYLYDCRSSHSHCRLLGMSRGCYGKSLHVISRKFLIFIINNSTRLKSLRYVQLILKRLLEIWQIFSLNYKNESFDLLFKFLIIFEITCLVLRHNCVYYCSWNRCYNPGLENRRRRSSNIRQKINKYKTYNFTQYLIWFKLQNVLSEEIKWHIDRRNYNDASRRFLDLIQLKVFLIRNNSIYTIIIFLDSWNAVEPKHS
jgi:hypothetical protein